MLQQQNTQLDTPIEGMQNAIKCTQIYKNEVDTESSLYTLLCFVWLLQKVFYSSPDLYTSPVQEN